MPCRSAYAAACSAERLPTATTSASARAASRPWRKPFVDACRREQAAAQRSATRRRGRPDARRARHVSAGQRELVDEAVVEVGPVGELDVLDVVEHRGRSVALLDGEERHLRALSGDVAGRDDPRQGKPRDEADPDRTRRREVGAERSGEEHLLDLADVDAELLDEQAPARRDRRLRELQLADVALREIDRVLDVALLAAPVEHEEPLPVLECDEAA